LLDAARRHAELPLAALFSSLINESRHFAEEGEFDDDICLVGFTFRKPLLGVM
jgi:hypothetical protein